MNCLKVRNMLSALREEVKCKFFSFVSHRHTSDVR